MKKKTGVWLLLAIFLGLVTWSSSSGTVKAQTLFQRGHHWTRTAISYSRLPLSFEVNEGQVNSQARYLARGQGFTVFLTSSEALLELSKSKTVRRSANGLPLGSVGTLPRNNSLRLWPEGRTPLSNHLAEKLSSSSRSSVHSWNADVVRLKLLGASKNLKISGEDQLPGYSSYFLGNNPRDWHTHIPNYAQVRYHHIYPGIDLVYYGRQGQLENDFLISPGANPKSIRLGLQGVKSLHLDRAGDLVVKVSGGAVYLRQPRAYQGRGAGRREVAVHYEIGAGNQVGFEVGRYDRQQELVIDPVLSYSTYLGGNGGDIGYGIAVDSSGDAYVTGTTGSTNFPTTTAGQTVNGGGNDIFVTKFNPAGTAFIYSVYMGGSGSDTATGIAIDSSGDAYVVGYTSSTSFPTTSGAFQGSNLGNISTFLTKLDPTGTTLVYSTYLGGSGIDYGRAVAVDASGDAFVTGSTQSTDFPTMNPLQVGLDGGSDAFVTEFNPTGTALLYSTYLGGSGADEALSIALDGVGNAYITGYTFSSNFPTQAAFQPSISGTSDAFVTEISPETSSLVFSTYLGGSGSDSAQSIALDSAGSIYLAGNTTSADFPVTSGAFQSSNHGGGDAFITKLAAGATQLVYSTLLGGSASDQANAIALDSSGNAFVTGFTQSTDFPLLDALQRILGISGASSCGATLCADAFVSEFGPSGSLVYSTYLGGSAQDLGRAIAVDTASAAYVTGSTTSTNFPVIAGAIQSAYAGTNSSPNVFVAKIAAQDAPAVALSPQTLNFGNQALNTTSNSQTVTLLNAGSASLGITSITASGQFSQTNNCGTVVPAGGGTCSIQVTFTPTQTGPVTDQITIADDAQGSPQTITVSGTGVTTGGSLTVSPTSLSFPATTVGDTSTAQTVQFINTGSTAVTISSISVSGDFAETNTCGNLSTGSYVLNVGTACSASVTFTPTATGSRTGSLIIQDNSTSGSQAVSLSGTGNAVFSLSTSARSTLLLIGTSSTTFTIAASAPSSFQGAIDLSCSNGATCSFNPTSITPGQTSALTVSGLSSNVSKPGPAPPVDFTVTGTSGNQTTSVALTIFFADFSLSQTPPSPPLASVTAGQSATYTVTVTPANGFNQVVLLGCANLPQGTDATSQKPDTTCTFSPPGITLNGTSAATATLTISTSAQVSSSMRPLPRGVPPPGTNSRFGWWVFLVVLGMISVGALALIGRRPQGTSPLRLRTSFAVLIMAALLTAFVAACNNTYVGPTTSAAVTGTPTGTHTITIIGTMGSNSSVQRTTTVNLAVSP